MSLGNAGSVHDFEIPNLKLSSAMKDLLAGSRTDRLPSDNPVASSPLSNLCPTPFDGIRFLKLFQRSGRAIRAGDILAKLLSKLHLRAFCSHFCELTLNQRFSVLPVPIASFGRRANTGPLRIPSRYFQGLTVPPVPPKVFKVRSIVRSNPTLSAKSFKINKLRRFFRRIESHSPH